MIIHKSFCFRIYPSKKQITRINEWNNALRFLWNLALEQWHLGLDRPKDERKYASSISQTYDLTELRTELPWLSDVPRNICAQLLLELENSWKRCFKKLAKAPNFKKKGQDFISLIEPHYKLWRLEENILRFPKLGNIRIVVHRPLEGKPKNCTIKRDGDQWFAIIMCEIEISDPITKVNPIVAIDRGVINIVADSDGQLIKSPRFYTHAMKRLASAQRNSSRKKTGSKNKEKANIRVMRIHRTIRRQREHLLHQLSHDYSKNHGTVIIEKLQIGNMVKANRGLARSILDSGWGKFAQFLKYKLFLEGGQLIEVLAAYSSQTCSNCGMIDSKSRQSQSIFHCTSCGHHEHADLNAAKVLKSRWNPSAQPVERSCRPRTPLRSRKRFKAVKSKTEVSVT